MPGSTPPLICKKLVSAMHCHFHRLIRGAHRHGLERCCEESRARHFDGRRTTIVADFDYRLIAAPAFIANLLGTG